MTYTTPVQSRSSVVTGANSQALSFISTPSIGNLIVVSIGTYNGALGLSAVTDNQSNVYTRDVVATIASGTEVATYSGSAINSSGTFTITVNPDGTSADFTFVIVEFSGNSASPTDKKNLDVQTGTTVTSLDITPSENNCLWVGAMTHAGTDTAITQNSGSLIHEDEGGSTHMPISVTYKIQTTATSESADWTVGASNTWAATIVSYRASAGVVSKIKKIGGIPLAKIKKVGGITVAKVKKVAGITNQRVTPLRR